MLPIVKHRKIWFAVSAALAGAGILAALLWGLKLGIDFTGGSLLELEFRGGRPEAVSVRDAAMAAIGSSDVTAQPLGEEGMVLRMPTLDEETHQRLLADLRAAFQTAEPPSGRMAVTEAEDGAPIAIELMEPEEAAEGVSVIEKRFESVGPLIGAELRRTTIYALLGAILAVALYITYVFRKVSKPVSAWKYGACTVAALCHDVAIPVGAYAALGHFYGIEVGAWVVTALLTVLGFSVHDTIVVFDRIRENLGKHRRESFEETVNRSVNESLARSVNTSATLLLVLIAAYVLGGESLKHFLLLMIIGVTAGTYSSIFFASPLLVTWQLRAAKR